MTSPNKIQIPYFTLDTKKLKQNYVELSETCKKYLKNFQIAYSVKTNSLPEVIKTLEKEKSGMEIASLNEIKLISKKNKFIVFNGPAKTEEELKIAIKRNFLINIDSISEIDKISLIIKNKPLQVGLRISLEEKSKFGIYFKEIANVIEYAQSKNIEIISLHFHSGTQQSISKYTTLLLEFARIIKKLNLKLKYINIGGGLPDKQRLKESSTSLEEYISKISQIFNQFNSILIIETGRFLTADAMELYSKVITIKNSESESFAILDIGINILSKITLATYKFSNTSKKEGEQKTYTIAGPLLFQNDILGKYQGHLEENDILKISNVGAYCYNLAWEISYNKPKITIL